MIEILAPADDGVPQIDGRPLPLADNVSTAFWAAAADGRLLCQECPACGHRQFYPRAACTVCAAPPEWLEVSGLGTVHTYTIIRQNWAEGFRETLPYPVAMIELAEGPHMMTNITHCDVQAVHIGMAVEAYVVKIEDGLGLPFWRPAT